MYKFEITTHGIDYTYCMLMWYADMHIQDDIAHSINDLVC